MLAGPSSLIHNNICANLYSMMDSRTHPGTCTKLALGKLSMNTTSFRGPLPRPFTQYWRTWSTFEFSQHAWHLLAPSPFSPNPGQSSSGGNSKRAEPVEHRGMSPIPEGVSHPDILLFAFDVSRINHLEDLRRLSSPSSTQISDIKLNW